MFSYLLSNVYELVARATLLALAIFPMSGIYADLIKYGGEAVSFSDLIVRGILVVLAFLTGKPFAKLAAIVAAGGFYYLFPESAISLGTQAFDFVKGLF